MRIRPIALPIMILTALAGCAPTSGTDVASTGAGTERQCFMADQVQNFREGPDRSLYLRALRNDVFRASTAGACLDLGSSLAIAIQPEAGASNRLCTGDWATVAIGGTRSAPCRIRIEERLTPEQVAALPSRSRP